VRKAVVRTGLGKRRGKTTRTGIKYGEKGRGDRARNRRGKMIAERKDPL